MIVLVVLIPQIFAATGLFPYASTSNPNFMRFTTRYMMITATTRIKNCTGKLSAIGVMKNLVSAGTLYVTVPRPLIPLASPRIMYINARVETNGRIEKFEVNIPDKS